MKIIEQIKKSIIAALNTGKILFHCTFHPIKSIKSAKLYLINHPSPFMIKRDDWKRWYDIIDHVIPGPIKAVFAFFYELYVRKKLIKFFILSLTSYAIVVVIFAVTLSVDYNDDDQNRGVLILSDSENNFTDKFTKTFPNENTPEHINWQGWEPKHSMWFYNTTIGSNLIPYDFFFALETRKSSSKNTIMFNSVNNIDKYRFIPQRKTDSNPEGLPLGLVRDTYDGIEYVGLTCAACHTNQINYKGTAIRIDGAPALVNIEDFIIDLSRALNQTLNNEGKKRRFIDNVLNRNNIYKALSSGRNYTNKAQIENDLIIYAKSLENHIVTNFSHFGGNRKKRLAYGFGRIDASGLTRNKILKSIQFEQNDQINIDKNYKNLPTPNAPVSYPALWDTTRLDYLNWNSSIPNTDKGKLIKYSSDTILSFATLKLSEASDSLLTVDLFKTAYEGKYIMYESSIDLNNLDLIHDHLKTLTSPSWAYLSVNNILPKINNKSAQRGQYLYERHCISCHEIINFRAPWRKAITKLSRVTQIGTDHSMVTNMLVYADNSGILESTYYDTNPGRLYIESLMPSHILQLKAIDSLVEKQDPDKSFVKRIYDYIEFKIEGEFAHNNIPTIKRGDYDDDTRINPLASLYAYRSRPLNGIWATAPYLHNGSVPTLYDLLLPPDKRPKSFYIGSREFDPLKVGFISEKTRGFLFNTNLPGNSNAGHDFGNSYLSEQNRLDLIEYLKTL